MKLVKNVEKKDYKSVLQLIKEGMDEYILPTTIYYSDKCSEYIRLLLSSDNLLSGYYYYGYYYNEQLVGFAEWRNFKHCLFLNNIYIDSKFRGKGIGSRLFQQGINLAKSKNKRFIELDVYSNNNRAEKWYSSLGFIPKSESYIIELFSLKNLSTDATYNINNYPQSIKILDEFGFTYLDINTITGLKKIGLLNDRYFRLSSLDDLKDEILLNTLKTISPNRKFLCITNNLDFQEPINYELIAKSKRLELCLY